MLSLLIDGAARGNPGPAGAGVAIVGPKGKCLKELALYLGETTNNVAEYAALVIALHEARGLGAECVQVQTDSELLAKQMNGHYRVKDPTLKVFHAIAQHLALEFSVCTIQHVLREHNRVADRLANRAVEHGLRAAKNRRPPSPVETDPTQRIFPFGPS